MIPFPPFSARPSVRRTRKQFSLRCVSVFLLLLHACSQQMKKAQKGGSDRRLLLFLFFFPLRRCVCIGDLGTPFSFSLSLTAADATTEEEEEEVASLWFLLLLFSPMIRPTRILKGPIGTSSSSSPLLSRMWNGWLVGCGRGGVGGVGTCAG